MKDGDPLLIGMRYRALKKLENILPNEVFSYDGPGQFRDKSPALILRPENCTKSIFVPTPWSEDHPEDWKKYFEPVDHFHFEKSKFIINPRAQNPIELTFEHEILSALEFDNVFIVLFKYTPTYKAEIYAIDKKGDVVWTSPQLPEKAIPEHLWTAMWRDEKKLYAYDACGFACELDLQTGRVVQKTFTK